MLVPGQRADFTPAVGLASSQSQAPPVFTPSLRLLYCLECERIGIAVNRSLALQLPELATDEALLEILDEPAAAAANLTSPSQRRCKQLTAPDATPQRFISSQMKREVMDPRRVPRPFGSNHNGNSTSRHVTPPRTATRFAATPPTGTMPSSPRPSRLFVPEQHQQHQQAQATTTTTTTTNIALTTELDFSQHVLGERGFIPLLSVIASVASSLRNLSLNNCHLTDDSAVKIADMLVSPQQNRSPSRDRSPATQQLRLLDLRNNNIGQRGGKALLRVVTAQIAQQQQQQQQSSSPLLRILVSGNSEMNPALIRQIEQPLDNRPHMYVYHLEGPEADARREELRRLKPLVDQLVEDEADARSYAEQVEASDRREIVDRDRVLKEKAEETSEARRRDDNKEDNNNHLGSSSGSVTRKRSTVGFAGVDDNTNNISKEQEVEQLVRSMRAERSRSFRQLGDQQASFRAEGSFRLPSMMPAAKPVVTAQDVANHDFGDLGGAKMETSMIIDSVGSTTKRRKKKKKQQQTPNEDGNNSAGSSPTAAAAATSSSLNDSALSIDSDHNQSGDVAVRRLQLAPMPQDTNNNNSNSNSIPHAAASSSASIAALSLLDDAEQFSAHRSSIRVLLPPVEATASSTNTSVASTPRHPRHNNDDDENGTNNNSSSGSKKRRRKRQPTTAAATTASANSALDAMLEDSDAITLSRESVAKDAVDRVLDEILTPQSQARLRLLGERHEEEQEQQSQSPMIQHRRPSSGVKQLIDAAERQLASELVRGVVASASALSERRIRREASPPSRGDSLESLGLVMTSGRRESGGGSPEFAQQFPALSILLKEL